MDRAQLQSACPALAGVLAADPALESVLQTLIDHGLERALPRYLADGSADAVRAFLVQARLLDLQRIGRHREALRLSTADPLGIDDVDPVRLVTLEEQGGRRTEDEGAGLESLSLGSWASLAFAGGSGTRFFSHLEQLDQAVDQPNEVLAAGGFDPAAPKGLFPISPVGGLRFYDQIVAEALHAGIGAGRLPWVLLLTSRVTHRQTLAYLQGSDLWGFPAGGWQAFPQADEPRLDADGNLVVTDDAGRLAWTGDGHGGVYRALLRGGADGRSVLDRIRADGVTQLVMHNVDNAAARPFAPARLGFHLREDARFTLSATRKTDPEEQVGVLMRIRATGKVEVVEYNVLDPAIAAQRDGSTGRLVHEAGNINTNLVSVEAIRPDIDPTLYTGKTISSRLGPVETSSLEMLNQHLTRLIDPDRVRAYEVARDEFFMPTKNVTGVDSVASTVATLSRRHALRLIGAGASVEPDALCDLHPACGSAPAALSRKGLGPGWRLGARSRLYLCVRLGAADGAPVAAGGLTLEPGASLVLDAARPYGDLTLGAGRRLQAATEAASRVSIGRDVVVRTGVRVKVRVGRGASLRVAPGRVFDRDVEASVGAGGALEL